MRKSTFGELILYRYRYVMGLIFLLGLSGLTLLYKLGNIVPGLNSVEGTEATSSIGLTNILNNPVNFVYKGLEYSSVRLLGPSAFALRLPSVALAILAILLFYLILNKRFSSRAAIISSIILSTSSWFLHVARLASPGILYVVLVLSLIYIATRLDEKITLFWLLLLGFLVGLSIYSPNFLYILVVGGLIANKTIRGQIGQLKKHYATYGLLVLILTLTPLVVAVVRDVSVAKELLSWPDALPSISGYFENLYGVVAHITWQSEPLAALHLGNLPMMDIFTASMVALGLYHYDNELNRPLSKFVLGGLGALILVLAVSADQTKYAVLIPFVYFIMAGGLVTLFTQWYEIFPKNPVARMAALIPMAVVLMFVTNYHLHRYFVAWPNNPEVVAAHPALYAPLASSLKEDSRETIVVTTKDESVLIAPLRAYYVDNQYLITLPEEIPDTARIIISNSAHQELDQEKKDSLPELLSISTTDLESEPVVLWTYQNASDTEQ